MMKRTVILFFIALWGTTLSAQDDVKPKGHFQLLTGYETDIYSKPNYWDYNIVSGGFGYKGNLTAIYGKVNLGYLYKEVDGVLTDKIQNKTQFELDYWQSFSKSKSTSIWLNYAYSQDLLFPNHRIVFELWQKLFAGFLVSGGVNHYIFSDGNDATFVNAGLEKYAGRFWVEGKTYLYLKEPDITTSYSLTGRVFFKDVNYLQLGVGMGSAQDEPFLIQSDLQRFYAYSANIKYTTNIFNSRMRLATGFTYSYEEYQQDVWRNRYAFGIGLIYNINK